MEDYVVLYKGILKFPFLQKQVSVFGVSTASIAMGASAAGVAKAILKEATESAQAVIDKLTTIREELKAAMLLTGSANISQLAKARHVILGETRQWMEQL